MATLCLISHLLSSVIHYQPQQCQTFDDIYTKAKYLWYQQKYSEAYRVFYELGETHQYQSSLCAWYQIQCLLALGHWRRAIFTCLEQANKCSSERWHLMASDIYMNRRDFTLAWEILNRAPDSVNVNHSKRLAYEGAHYTTRCIRRSDILDKLPYDVVINVFLCLDLPSLVRCTRVSRRWRHCLVSSPHLWSELEFVKQAAHLPISTVKSYLSRLGKTPLSKLTIRHQQADGDEILMALLAQEQCYHLKTLIIMDMICTPALFLNTLEHIGSSLYTLHWSGISLRLNSIMDILPKVCTRLKTLVVQDCFTSIYEAQLHNGATYILENFGDRFPKAFIEKIESLTPLPTVETLELSGIHGLTTSHLANIVIRCPNLKKLVLNRCLVNIIPVMNILLTSCSKLQHFEYERNRYCHQFDTSLYQLSSRQANEKKRGPYFNKPHYPWKHVKIHLTYTLTDNVLKCFLHSSKSTLETLDLRGNTIISEQGLLSNTPMRNLKRLYLRECYGITSKGLATLIAQSSLLEHADLSNLRIINDDVLLQLTKCQKLQTLDLSYANLIITDKTFKYFIDQQSHTLKNLVLDFSNISKELLCYSMINLKKGTI